MSSTALLRTMNVTLRWAPLFFLAAICLVFGGVSPRFLTLSNLSAILTQSSWLMVVAIGMNFVLLTAGVDLSVGAAMYLSVVVLGLGFASSPVWVCLPVAVLIGAGFGALNGSIIVRFGLPAFIVTLATIFIGRGLAIYLSSTKIVFASLAVADLGRAHLVGVPLPLCFAGGAVLLSALLLRATPFGSYVRSVGADAEGARRAGVPTKLVSWSVYCLCGAFAGLGSFISFSQTSSASAAFGQNAEFLAIAAAVLGGTSLFGGRGSLWAPVMGAILITTVQNGLVIMNANPYAYPVITGAVIFVAALLDSIRLRFVARAERRPIRVEESMPSLQRTEVAQTNGKAG
jgi:ribose transport system permease protein